MSPSSQAARKRRGDLLALLARDVEAAPALLDVAVGPGQDLAAVRRALADDRGDLLVGVVEHLAQQEHRALDGRELLEQVQERERQRVGRLGVPRRLVGHDRLGQPLAGVGLAAHRAERSWSIASRVMIVDEVRLRRLDVDVGLRGSAGTPPAPRPRPR